MAIFSGKIIDVYYTEDTLSNVTLLYNYEKDGETLVGEYNLVVDETEEQFQDLLREVTYQEIEANTINRHKANFSYIRTFVDEEVRRQATQEIISDQSVISDKHFVAFFEYDSELHADELFKCKMYLFSLDMVKNGSKVFRTKMRKAEDLLELCRLFSAEKRRIERKESK